MTTATNDICIVQDGDGVVLTGSSPDHPFLPPEGTYGTVVGFDRETFHVGLNSPDLVLGPPGVYSRIRAPIVRWAGERMPTIAPMSLLDAALEHTWKDREICAPSTSGRTSPREMVREAMDKLEIALVGALPETVASEGDVIRPRYGVLGHEVDEDVLGIVLSVDYDKIAAGGHAYVVQTIRYGRPAGIVRLRSTDFDLLGRGRYHRHWNGLRDEIFFMGPVDEARFEFSLMRADEVRNPRTHLFGFSAEEASSAFREGRIDFLRGTDSSGRRLPVAAGWRLDDRILAERLRAALDPIAPFLDVSTIDYDARRLTARRHPEAA